MSRFTYITFIRTRPAKLWEALTEPAIIRQWWFGAIVECAWTKGAPWKLRAADGKLLDDGEIVEIDPPRSMVIRWTNQWKPDFKSEGPSRCAIDLAAVDAATRLVVTHTIDRDESRFIAAISAAWPLTLSNLKSFLETGAVAVATHPGHS